MGFSLSWPNMALTKKLDLRPNLVSKERKKNVKAKKEKKRKRKRRRRRRRRRRGRGREAKIKLRYGTTWAFKALNSFPCNCMVISCLQPRVLLGFHPNPIIIESKVDKTIKSTRSI